MKPLNRRCNDAARLLSDDPEAEFTAAPGAL